MFQNGISRYVQLSYLSSPRESISERACILNAPLHPSTERLLFLSSRRHASKKVRVQKPVTTQQEFCIAYLIPVICLFSYGPSNTLYVFRTVSRVTSRGRRRKIRTWTSRSTRKRDATPTPPPPGLTLRRVRYRSRFAWLMFKSILYIWA